MDASDNMQLHDNVRGRYLWVTFGFLPFALSFMPVLDIALISAPLWPGYSKGILISLVDIVAFMFYIVTPSARQRDPLLPAMIFYFVTVALSLFQAQIPMSTVFYLWQLVRMYLVYRLVATVCRNEIIMSCIFKGLCAGLFLEACVTIWQRFGLGILKASGTYVHQNTLGMISYAVAIPLFAVFISGRKGWEMTFGPLSGVIVAVLTASRATLGFMGMGLVAVYVFSMYQRVTPRKLRAGLLAILILVALAPTAFDSMAKRFANLEYSYDERGAFQSAASMILEDYPMGIGANNYVIKANVGGYMDRSGVAPSAGSRSTMVHNVYWLIGAETGYLGVFAFVYLMLKLMVVAFRSRIRRNPGYSESLMLGSGVAVFAVCSHSFFEWILMTDSVQYFFAILAGTISGLSRSVESVDVEPSGKVPRKC